MAVITNYKNNHNDEDSKHNNNNKEEIKYQDTIVYNW